VDDQEATLNDQWPLADPLGDAEVDEGSGGGCWWANLPSTYTVRRKWPEIARFHEELVSGLSYDHRNQIRRTKTKPPDLPAKGDLDAFILGVAAAGDACCLNGKKRLSSSAPTTKEEEARARSAEDLDDLCVIYVENRLMPYFKEVSKVLSELPTEILLESTALRRFATERKTIKGSGDKKKIFGPRPCLLDAEETEIQAQVLRRQYPDLVMGRPSRPSTEPPKKKREKNSKDASALKPSGPMSPISGPRSPSSPSQMSPRSPTFSGDFEVSSAQQRPATSFDIGGRDPWQRERRLATSHYGFFARSLPDSAFQAFGHASQRDFWKRMAAKEQRELGRRTMLRFKKPSSMSHLHGGRLPSLPPGKPREVISRHNSQADLCCTPDRAKSRAANVSILELSGGLQDSGPTRERRTEMREDIREGLRVSILGEAASEEPHTKRMAALVADPKPPVAEMPSQEQALKVYKKYRELHDADADVHDDSSAFGEDDENDEEDFVKQQRSRVARLLENGFKKELLPISWQTFLSWVQREHDFAGHFRYKAVCSALLLAMRRWRQWEATATQQRYGVSLNMMLQWTFPGLNYADLAQILTWIALHELQQICMSSPRVMETQDRRQLESIFNAMATAPGEYCTPEDVAGGDVEDVSKRLKNIVDVETVRNVCGDGKMSQEAFLELFCEDNLRAFANSKSAMLQDGSKVVQVAHPAVGFTGWVYENPPKEEERQRELINALEAEVLRWKSIAQRRKTKLTDLVSEGAVLL
jgi:hypothetical protein